jgi:hypothetical protein
MGNSLSDLKNLLTHFSLAISHDSRSINGAVS